MGELQIQNGVHRALIELYMQCFLFCVPFLLFALDTLFAIDGRVRM